MSIVSARIVFVGGNLSTGIPAVLVLTGHASAGCGVACQQLDARDMHARPSQLNQIATPHLSMNAGV